MKKKLLSWIILFFVSSSLLAQEMDSLDFQTHLARIDSLLITLEYPNVLVSTKQLLMDSSSLSDRQKINLKVRRAIALAENEKPDSSRIILQEANDYFVSNKDTLNNDFAFVLDTYAFLASRKERKEAKAFYLRSLSIRRTIFGETDLNYVNSLNKLAIVNYQMSEYREAVSRFLKILDLEIYGEEDISLGIIMNNLAATYDELGEYKEAEPLFLKTLEIYKKLLGENNVRYATSLNNLANLYIEMGNYEKAEPLFLKALEIYENVTGENNIRYAGISSSFGNLYYKMGKYKEAEPLFLKAIEIKKNILGENSTSYATSLNNLANLYRKTGKYEKAEPLFLKAVEIYKTVFGENNYRYASSINSLGLLYHKMGKYEKAKPLYTQAKEIRKKVVGEEHHYYIVSLNNLTRLNYDLGDYKQTAFFSIRSANLRKKLVQQSFQFLSEKEKNDYQLRIIKAFDLIKSLSNDYKDAELYTELYNLSLFEKNLKLNSSLQTRRYILSQKDSLLEEKYNDLTANYRVLAKEYEKPIDQRKNVDLLENKIALIEKELARASASFKKEQQLHKIEVDQLRGFLQPDEIAIEFLHFKYQKKKITDSIIYAACVLDPSQSEVLFIPLFAENNSIIASLNKKITRGSIKRMYSYTDPSILEGMQNTTLYDLVWAPLDAILQGKKRIYYAASGLLYRLNLNAIPIDATTVMGDRFEMYNLMSTKSIALPEEVEQNQIAYIVGAINYDLAEEVQVRSDTFMVDDTGSSFGAIDRSLTKDKWGDLPATKSETLTLSNRLKKANYQVTYKTKDQATEESFKTLGTKEESPRIIHLATHGFFFPDAKVKLDASKEPIFKMSENPMLRSGIILAGANHTWEGNPTIPGKEDGILTAYEISHMNLSNTELVVLSACKTGLGDIQGSEGVYGLQRAFKKAGVKYLVMSLWEVDDEKTAVFMSTFYKYWLEKKQSIRSAFNTTQLEMKNKYSNPMDWAGFVLIE